MWNDFGTCWFVVYTKHNSERYASKFLAGDAFRFTVYCPHVKVRRVHAGRIDHVARPLLLRYLFVLDQGQGAAPIRNAPGVASLVRSGDVPILVRQDVINAIRGREDADGFVRLDDVVPYRPRFHQDERVRIRDGHLLSGFNALFQYELGDNRAVVFARMLGKLNRVVVDLDVLEKV